MKMISWILLACISMNVFADSVKSLSLAMEDYEYAVTVQGESADTQGAILLKRLNDLVVNEGLETKDIFSYLESRISDKRALENLKTQAHFLKENSAEEMARILTENNKNLFAKGASWNGQTISTAVLWSILLLPLAYAIWWGATHECVERSTVEKCGYNSNDDYSCSYPCLKYEKK